MSDAETILLVLIGFYLFECAAWVRPGAVLLVAQLPGSRRCWLRQTALLQNDGGALLFGNLLPFGHAVAVQPWPFAVSPTGIYAYRPTSLLASGRPPYTERFLAFEEVQKVETDGGQLLVNGVLLARLSSPGLARHLAKLLHELKGLPDTERSGVIERALDASLDVEEIGSRFRAFRRRSFPLLVACLGLFAFFFVLLPALLYFDAPILWRPLLASYLLFWSLAAMEFYSAHSQFYPKEAGARRRHLGMMLVSPADAVHSRDVLFRELLCTYHPLAAAAALCSRPAFEQFAARLLRDHFFPQLPELPADASPAARAVEGWFRTCLDFALARCLSRHKVEVEAILRHPEPDGARCLSCCPRCLGQYEHAEGICDMCHRPLLHFGAWPEIELPAVPPAPVETVKASVKEPVAAMPAPREKEPRGKKKKSGRRRN